MTGVCKRRWNKIVYFCFLIAKEMVTTKLNEGKQWERGEKKKRADLKKKKKMKKLPPTMPFSLSQLVRTVTHLAVGSMAYDQL